MAETRVFKVLLRRLKRLGNVEEFIGTRRDMNIILGGRKRNRVYSENSSSGVSLNSKAGLALRLAPRFALRLGLSDC